MKERTPKREADGRTYHLGAKKYGESETRGINRAVGGDTSIWSQGVGEGGSLGQPRFSLGAAKAHRTFLSKDVMSCNFQRKAQYNGHKRVSWLLYYKELKKV